MAQFSLLGMAQHLSMIVTHVAEAEHEALERASKLVLEEAKREIGTYQGAAGPFPAWEPLAPSTLEKKAADTPLLETGEMRDSYERTVGVGEAWVGSNNMKAVWQELGTPTIPPRSVIGMAAVHKEQQIRDETGRLFLGVLTAPSRGGVQQVIRSKP